LRAYLNGCHAYENIWIDDGNGGLVNSDIQPEVKQALAALQDMFKKGLIDPEFAVKDTEKAAKLLYRLLASFYVLGFAEWNTCRYPVPLLRHFQSGARMVRSQTDLLPGKQRLVPVRYGCIGCMEGVRLRHDRLLSRVNQH